MSSIPVRNLDPVLEGRLRVCAALHGHSMEAEVRRILREALVDTGRTPDKSLDERIRARFAPLGGVELELPPREPARRSPRFG